MTEISQLVISTEVLSISNSKIVNSNFCYAFYVFGSVCFYFYTKMNLLTEFKHFQPNHLQGNENRNKNMMFAFTAVAHVCPDWVYTSQTLMANFCMLLLTSDPKGHLQAPITLTFGEASVSNISPHRVCFMKALFSPQWFQLGHRFSKREFNWNTVWGVNVGFCCY